MASKTSTEVIIGGKVYTLSGYEGEEYLQKVASYINNKINELEQLDAVKRFTIDKKAALIELNIADDYFKAKERVEMLEKELEEKEKRLYDLNHELVAARVERDAVSKTQKELESKMKELELHKAKLETALEDALLGVVSNKNDTKPEDKKKK